MRQHPDHLVIHKLRTNQPLTETDVKTLENILWSEVGTQKDYEAAYGRKPLGEFVREIVGLDIWLPEDPAELKGNLLKGSK